MYIKGTGSPDGLGVQTVDGLRSSYSGPTPPPPSAITASVAFHLSLPLSSLCIVGIELACPSPQRVRFQIRRQQKTEGLFLYILSTFQTLHLLERLFQLSLTSQSFLAEI